jgi:ATP/maltotriose-dependent transcriptional regulator MalT
MTPTSSVDHRVAQWVAVRNWDRVRTALVAAHQVHDLNPRDLEFLAEACWWLGQVNECIEARRRALDGHLRQGDVAAAAGLALLLSEDHRRQGRSSVAESWRRRAAKLLDGVPECVHHGYLRLYQGEVARRNGDIHRARLLLDEATAIAQQTGNADLAADVTQEQGRLMILSGARSEGLARMDEAMLSASNGTLTPYTTGKIYCCLISACDELGDLQRMVEWEQASTLWSDAQGVNVFPGMCRVHRADLLAHFGLWSQAEHEAEQACDELRELGWIVAYAYNTIGQIRCRRGDLDGAARAFSHADKLGAGGADLEAGVSMMLIAQGDYPGALHRISRALTTTTTPLSRLRLLPTAVSIAITVGDLDLAAATTTELEQIASHYGTLIPQARASLARSQLLLALGEWDQACVAVDTALGQWQQLSAPYEIAITRTLQAQACHALNDHHSTVIALDAAADIFGALGARIDLAQLEDLRSRLSPATMPSSPGGLTPREAEVLRLLATGATNKQIAAQLVLSEKTVARHLSNTFTKLGVSTRTAAAAYAYQHNLTDHQPAANR